MGTINGWDIYRTYFLLAVNQCTIYAYQMLAAKGIGKLPKAVRTGNLDFYLTKPVDLQFMFSLQSFDIKPLLYSVVPVSIMAYLLWTRDWHVSLSGGICFLAAMAFGVLLRYVFAFATSTCSIYFVNIYALNAMQSEFFQYAGYPVSIFSKAEAIFFTFAIPIIAIANIPASFIFHNIDYAGELFCATILMTFIFLMLVRKFFYHALSSYCSASS